jgi:hypothetical protein
MLKLLKRFSTYTLVVALVISAISAYYSIVGLTAIFAAAVTPIIIMGAALELGKLTAAVWLKLNWQRANLIYKFYLVPAVAFLMVLTSMGIFGFLSKAHSDQSLVTGDSQAKIAIYDEKIKIQRDNITANKAALTQMDAQVNDIMSKGDSERSVERSVQIRRQQAGERAKLLKEIEVAQTNIQKLNEERAPLAAENRKVEAEVGPIKYIAALIYDENPDANLLEKAVRFVIIMIVAVFDPLALVLILAAQQSMRWEREDEEEGDQDVEEWFKRAKENARELDREAADHAAKVTDGETNTDPSTSTDDKADAVSEVKEEVEDTRSVFERFPYLGKPFYHFTGLKPMASKSADEVTWPEVPKQPVDLEQPESAIDTVKEELIHQEISNDEKILSIGVDVIDRPGDYVTPTDDAVIETANVTSELKMFNPRDEYVTFEGKSTSMTALKNIRPDLILPDSGVVPNKFKFGEQFPREALIGDLCMRVEVKPHRLYKFNGMEWMHVDKNQNTSYLANEDYLKLLIDKLNTNEYLPEMLTEAEEEEITAFLQK